MSGTRILCCGEALIDMIPTDAEDGLAYRPCSGGAVFNTAIALGRLGVATEFFSGLSTDLFGQKLCRSLKDSGVSYALSARSNRPTTLAFVALRDGHASYHFYDENSAGRMLTPQDIPPIPKEIGALYFGGISLCVEPGASTYEEIAVRHSEKRVVMIDPNIRPGFIADEARYRDRLIRMVGKADLVKVSDEDLAWISPHNGALENQVADLINAGPKIVIVTRGAKGAIAFLADGQSITVDAVRVEVIDTVGAGDSFNAGIMAKLGMLGILHKEAIASISPAHMQEAMHFASQVASITVSRKGADSPWPEEVGME